MAQYLGGVFSGAHLASVVNFASGTIPRGRIVSLYPDADQDFSEGIVKMGQGSGAGHAFKIAVQEWVVTTKDYPVGVVVNDIPQGGEGSIVIIGPAIVETDGTVVAGNKLQIAAPGAGLGGVADVYAAGQAFGVALSTDQVWTNALFGGVRDGPDPSPDPTYALCFVNFVGLLVD